MSAVPPVVVIEGPSDSGKSTLARGLIERGGWEPAVLLPCYADLVDASALPPDVAPTVEEQLRGLEFFLELDRHRSSAIEGAPRIVVADRSWLSLLAHTYAVEKSGGPGAYAAARERLTNDGSLLAPDVVIVLDADDATRRSRMGSQDRCAWFTSPAFNQHLQQFFRDEAGAFVPRLIVLDAQPCADDLLEDAVRQIADSGVVR